jgi:hypothetical protein
MEGRPGGISAEKISLNSYKRLVTGVGKVRAISSLEKDHQKAERVLYRDGIQDFWSFGQSKTQKLSSIPSQFCPETEISSETDLQNSVTSKPLGGQSRMSNG